jgi:hypothetical protein
VVSEGEEREVETRERERERERGGGGADPTIKKFKTAADIFPDKKCQKYLQKGGALLLGILAFKQYLRRLTTQACTSTALCMASVEVSPT